MKLEFDWMSFKKLSVSTPDWFSNFLAREKKNLH